MITIPTTTPQRYITSTAALNIPAPEGTTGDWRFGFLFFSDDIMLHLGGEKSKFVNTNPIYGNYGIHECSRELKKRGVKNVPEKVYSANHFRATLDLLYKKLQKNLLIPPYPIWVKEWFDTEEQCLFLLEKALDMMPFLNVKQQESLSKWIKRQKQDIEEEFHAPAMPIG